MHGADCICRFFASRRLVLDARRLANEPVDIVPGHHTFKLLLDGQCTAALSTYGYKAQDGSYCKTVHAGYLKP